VNRILLIGIGNPGRRDDGLGPALADAVERLGIPDLTVDAEYQLQAEDAAAIAEHAVVVFADADATGPEPFSFRSVAPVRGLSFSSHSLEPGALLALAEETLDARPEAWVLGIRGYELEELSEGLSDRARDNLRQAIEFIEPVLRHRAFREAPGSG
jgi:hydrogenase maturation protease